VSSGVYNPLDKVNLARSIEGELLSKPVIPLTDLRSVTGAGVYAIYYAGNFAPYAPLAEKNRDNKFELPIYVGKSMPRGGRKGALDHDASTSPALRNRLTKHSRSLDEVKSLSVSDFFVRYLVVDLIWIPLGENMLIRTYAPVWNRVVEGFGINAPGGGREKQRKSQWDTIHPGRRIAQKRAPNALSEQEILDRIARHFRGEAVPAPPDLDDDEDDDEAEPIANE
jgi:hypothetical protein